MPNLNNADFAKAVIKDAIVKTSATLKYLDVNARAAAMVATQNTKLASETVDALREQEYPTVCGIAIVMNKVASGDARPENIDPEALMIAREIASLAK